MPNSFKLHKPYGYLSQFINRGPKQKSKKLLGELHAFPDGSMAVGRLDENSEGLLIITTDGKLSDKLRSPEVEKEYWVQVDGIIHDTALEDLRNGVTIKNDGQNYKTKSCEVHWMKDPGIAIEPWRIKAEKHGPASWIKIIIREGKFRQVRKMTAAVGFPTRRLIRVRIGEIGLGNLLAGEIEPLNPNEILFLEN